MTPETRRELLRLLSSLCDGGLTDAEYARLEELLNQGAEAREHYLQYVDMHARLLVRPDADASTRLPPAPGRSLKPLFRYALVAGATLAASLLVQLAWWPRPAPDGTTQADAPPRYVATLTRTA